MGMPIIPWIYRGRLYFLVADVLFPSLRAAAHAWAAANAHRLDLVDIGGES